MFIDGKFVSASGGDKYGSINPCTEEVLTDIHMASEEDVNRAVESSKKAFENPEWSAMHPTARAALMFKIADHLQANSDELAFLESLENGKPFMMAQRDLGFISAIYRFMGGQADKIEGKTFINEHENITRYTQKAPIGVCGSITPWNFPNLMSAFKIAPMLAAGCTGVIKPSEMTSLGTIRMAELLYEAGLPAGVLNVVPGRGHIAGHHLVTHSDVHKVAFTGSTKVGLEILKSVGNKKTVLEMGGNCPAIVTEHADVAHAASVLSTFGFAHSGQICMQPRRVYVHEKVYDEFLEQYSANVDVW